jgi:type II secretory pathway component GspD/PulD (secretin)
MIVREKILVLREINKIIETAKKNSYTGNLKFEKIELKHIDPETLLITVRPMMGFMPDMNVSADGSLSISIAPYENVVYAKGIQNRIDEFKTWVGMLDTPVEGSGGPIEKPYFATYRVRTDPKLALQVLETVFEGEQGLILDIDEKTGDIFAYWNREGHERIQELLNRMNAGDSIGIIKVANLDPDDLVIKIEELMGITTESTTGPKLVAEPEFDRILVHGTPQEIAMVREWVEKLDTDSKALNGPRTNTRFFDLDPSRTDEIMSLLATPGFMESLGRPNTLNIVLPAEREDFRARMRRDGRQQFGLESQDADQLSSEYQQIPPELENIDPRRLKKMMPERRGVTRFGSNDEKPSEGTTSSETIDPTGGATDDGANPNTQSGDGDTTDGRTYQMTPDSRDEFYVSAPLAFPQELTPAPRNQVPGGAANVASAANRIAQEDPLTIGRASAEQTEAYRPPPPLKSVDGAPIIIRVTEEGTVVLQSDDLDALDDLEDFIADRLDATGAQQAPTFFYLDHRKAAEAKSLLDSILGLSDSSGGGGGGLGGLLGNALQNAVGETAGDALGGLLGGGMSSSGSSTTGIELEGDVTIGVDIRLNSVFVIGATSTDMRIISDIIDYIDQPGPPHDLDLLGITRSIPILYRDATELRDIIQQQLSDYFSPKSSAGGGGGNNNDQANAQAQMQQQMARAIQQLAGGQRNNRGSNNPDAEKPVATLGVDEQTNSLLVTGPEFIYLHVLRTVEQLDNKSLNEKAMEAIGTRGVVDTGAILQMLREVYGSDKIVIETTEEEEATGSSANQGRNESNPFGQQGGGNSNRRSGGGRTGGGGGGGDAARMEALQNFGRMMQRAQESGGGGGAVFVAPGSGAGGGSFGPGAGGGGTFSLQRGDGGGFNRGNFNRGGGGGRRNR